MKFYLKYEADALAIPYSFVDNYMIQANELQLKLYILLVKKAYAEESISIASLADILGCTEEKVLRAMQYWKYKSILDFDYDKENNIEKILLKDVLKEGKIFCSNGSKPNQNTTTTKEFVKPQYTPDQLREFKNRRDFDQLFFIIESYIGKPLTSSEMVSVMFFINDLGFSPDMVDYLMQYCVSKSKKNFIDIEKVAINWAKEGYKSPEDVKKHMYPYDGYYYDILYALEKCGNPTKKEAAYINHWISDYGFQFDIIIEACQRAVKNTKFNRIEYADRILKTWMGKQVRTFEDIIKADEEFRNRRKEQNDGEQKI